MSLMAGVLQWSGVGVDNADSQRLNSQLRHHGGVIVVTDPMAVSPPPCVQAAPLRRRWRWRAPWVLCLAAVLAADGAAADGCPARVLGELGWRIETGVVAQPRIDAGQPCQRGSLAQAQAAGDLRLTVPAGLDRGERDRLLRALLADQASRCAYAFRLGEATRRATARLQTNPGYRFSALQTGWIGFGVRGARAQGWQRFRSFGRGYRPVAGNARAIEAFYSGRVRAECGVGRQVAQLASQRELYGDAAFDRAFSAGELSIGTFISLHDSDSILLGRHAGELFADGKAERSVRLGRQALIGAPGFIAHVFARSELDDINNQAENFVVVDVDAAAAAALAAHAGLRYYDEINRQIWALAQQMPQTGYRRFERLLYQRDPALWRWLPASQRRLVTRMRALLDDPFYQGFQIYVHPLGVRPIGFHIARLLDRNPRTPYAIELTLHNLHTTLYQRWIDSRLRDCGDDGPAPSRD